MTLITEKKPSPSRSKGNKSPKSHKDKPAGAKASPSKGKKDGTKPDEIPDSTPVRLKKQPPAPITDSSNKTGSNREQKPPGDVAHRTILKDDKPEQEEKSEQSEQVDDNMSDGMFDDLSTSRGPKQDSFDQGQTDPGMNESNRSADDNQDPSTHGKMTHMEKLMASGKTITQDQIARAHLLDEGAQNMEALQDSSDEPEEQENPIPSPPKVIHEATTEDNLAEKGQKDLNAEQSSADLAKGFHESFRGLYNEVAKQEAENLSQPTLKTYVLGGGYKQALARFKNNPFGSLLAIRQWIPKTSYKPEVKNDLINRTTTLYNQMKGNFKDNQSPAWGDKTAYNSGVQNTVQDANPVIPQDNTKDVLEERGTKFAFGIGSSFRQIVTLMEEGMPHSMIQFMLIILRNMHPNAKTQLVNLAIKLWTSPEIGGITDPFNWDLIYNYRKEQCQQVYDELSCKNGWYH